MTKRNRRSSTFPLLLIALGLILMVGALAWYAYMFSRPAPVSVPAQPAEANYPDVARVSLADAKAAYDTGSAVFLDVRDAESYSQSHIVGAVSIPLEELPARMGELSESDWIITYCT
jgi:3-mercaptopyruvate sulfurtransferase SseA